jgi:hypothetical protein
VQALSLGTRRGLFAAFSILAAFSAAFSVLEIVARSRSASDEVGRGAEAVFTSRAQAGAGVLRT